MNQALFRVPDEFADFLKNVVQVHVRGVKEVYFIQATWNARFKEFRKE